MGIVRSKLPKKIRKVVELTYSHYGDRYVVRPKYSNRSQECWEKHRHQSMLESDLCNQLTAMKKAGEITAFTTQHKIELVVNGVKVGTHYVDFFVIFSLGRTEFWEAKGYDTDVWKIKKKIVEALYPDIPYVVKREKPNFYRPKKGR